MNIRLSYFLLSLFVTLFGKLHLKISKGSMKEVYVRERHAWLLPTRLASIIGPAPGWQKRAGRFYKPTQNCLRLYKQEICPVISAAARIYIVRMRHTGRG